MNNESKNSGIIEIGSVVDVPWVTDEIVDLVSLPLENWDEIPPSNRGEFPCRVFSLKPYEKFPGKFAKLDAPSFSRGLMSVPEPELLKLFGDVADYKIVWENDTGGATILQEPRRFFFQTPNDGATGEDFFCSFAMASHEQNTATTEAVSGESVAGRVVTPSTTFDGVFISSASGITVASLLENKRIPANWIDNDLAMMYIPIAIAKKHSHITSEKLATLIRSVVSVEDLVAAGTKDLAKLTMLLHKCNTSLISLRRRWHFEITLVDAICEFIEYYQVPVSSVNWNLSDVTVNAQHDVYMNVVGPKSPEEVFKDRKSREALSNTKEFRALHSDAHAQRRFIKTAEYDLNVLPKRIENASAAVFAGATLRDSSSMRTIAVMTLVFLPSTAVSALFSMTMFNWNAGPGERLASKYIWVYFLITVPITLLVMSIWWWAIKDRGDNVNRHQLAEVNA